MFAATHPGKTTRKLPRNSWNIPTTRKSARPKRIEPLKRWSSAALQRRRWRPNGLNWLSRDAATGAAAGDAAEAAVSVTGRRSETTATWAITPSASTTGCMRGAQIPSIAKGGSTTRVTRARSSGTITMFRHRRRRRGRRPATLPPAMGAAAGGSSSGRAVPRTTVMASRVIISSVILVCRLLQ